MKIEADGMRLTGTGNAREHHFVRAKRVKKEKEAVAWRLKPFERPALPCTFILTRCAPGNGLDDDGCVHSLKGVRDAIAEWMLIDDKHRELVRYVYEQRRAPWGVVIESRDGVA